MDTNDEAPFALTLMHVVKWSSPHIVLAWFANRPLIETHLISFGIFLAFIQSEHFAIDSFPTFTKIKLFLIFLSWVCCFVFALRPRLGSPLIRFCLFLNVGELTVAAFMNGDLYLGCSMFVLALLSPNYVLGTKESGEPCENDCKTLPPSSTAACYVGAMDPTASAKGPAGASHLASEKYPLVCGIIPNCPILSVTYNRIFAATCGVWHQYGGGATLYRGWGPSIVSLFETSMLSSITPMLATEIHVFVARQKGQRFTQEAASNLSARYFLMLRAFAVLWAHMFSMSGIHYDFLGFDVISYAISGSLPIDLPLRQLLQTNAWVRNGFHLALSCVVFVIPVIVNGPNGCGPSWRAIGYKKLEGDQRS